MSSLCGRTVRIYRRRGSLHMVKTSDIDRALLLTVLVLVIIGIAMIYSTSYIMALNKYKDGYLFLKKELIFVAISLSSLLLVMRVPYTIYQKLTLVLLLLSFVSLALVFVPSLGFESGGSKRWIKVGVLTFQPSEFSKLAMVMYLASFFSRKGEKVKTFHYGFLPPLIIGGVMMALLLKEPDFGATVTLVIIIVSMMFVAGVKIRYIFSLGMASIPIFYLIITTAGYRLNRILSFLDPWKEPDKGGFQIIQSFIAFGRGELWGVGLGEGKQKLFYLPEAHTDFILSAAGEELGLVGVGVIIILFFVIIMSGIAVALKAKDLFGMYLAFGITSLIGIQTIINMGVVTGLLPTKGLTLPFVSYGGTSLLMSMISIGILLNISLTEKSP
jgi:cell division protein FtsW